MAMDRVLDRFFQQSPITVMARLALQRALEPSGSMHCSCAIVKPSTRGNCCSRRRWS